jgi:hypothetical protein
MRVRDHFRAHGRKSVSLPARLRDERASFTETARIKNLGLGGACVEVFFDSLGKPSELPTSWSKEAEVLRVDAALLLEVVAPTLWDPLLLRGRVAWLKRSSKEAPTRFGLRFEHQEEGSLFALFQLLGAHSFTA